MTDLNNKLDEVLLAVNNLNEAASVGEITGAQFQDGMVGAKAQLLTIIEQTIWEVIGKPLEKDVSYIPTIEDPYGRVQMRNQSSTPKTAISPDSWETVSRQRQRATSLLKALKENQ